MLEGELQIVSKNLRMSLRLSPVHLHETPV